MSDAKSTLERIKVERVTPDTRPIVGIVIVADKNIAQSSPAIISDGRKTSEAPLKFYSGDLNMIRTELHRAVDEAIDVLLDGDF